MARNIAVFADGTWESNEVANPTNVVKLHAALLPQDTAGNPQISVYQIGLGSEGLKAWRVLSGATGAGLSENVQDLYGYLVLNYRPRDRLFLFGFSRGAYTVRSLSGLIRSAGILRPENFERIKEAYAIYIARGLETHPRAVRSRNFRQAYAWPEFAEPDDFVIHCIGVWDTVGALGIPGTGVEKLVERFHDTDLSTFTHYAFQALAVDERRSTFMPCVWTQQAGAPTTQVLEQTWFAGVHSDVGGGYKEDGLSNDTLAWMWLRAEQAGLALDKKQFPARNPFDTLHNSLTGLFKLLSWFRSGVRKIILKQPPPAPNTNQGVHESVKARYDKQDAKYRPKNLEAYLKDPHSVYVND
ncbi:MAG: DUF2235 domain-containing protein [Gammaproteobacteria bacterium]|nr:DUF2235 domain-containing protein [Gammaproteobacteria bacterium]